MRNGFEVTFVAASMYKDGLEDIGCSFVSLEGIANFSENVLNELPYSVRLRI